MAMAQNWHVVGTGERVSGLLCVLEAHVLHPIRTGSKWLHAP